MSRYCIKSPEVDAIKKYLQKLDYFQVETPEIIGELKITGFRKYKFDCELDVEFKGKAKLRCGSAQPTFFDSSVSKRPRVSKIKLNRILRRYFQTSLDIKMRYVGENLRYYSCIKKITWI